MFINKKQKDNKNMENILNFFTKIVGLNTVNEGYIGLTSFEKPIAPPQQKETVAAETVGKTSLTGILRRVS